MLDQSCRSTNCTIDLSIYFQSMFQFSAFLFFSLTGKDVYKLYYATPVWLPGTQGCEDSRICPCDAVTYHDPPLLYNIGRDPSEIHQLSIADYGDVVELINKAVADHKSTIPANIQSQFSLFRMIPNPLLQPCCNFPHCTCVDSVSDIK